MPIEIAFFDCDGTLTKVKSSWEYIHRRLGIWDNRADEYQRLFREGLIDYDEFCRRDALLWKGLTLQDIQGIVDEIPYQEGARETIGSLRGAGIFTVILSTGLSFLVDKVGRELGINLCLSNELLSEQGVLTGGTRINVEHDGKGFWVNKILGDMGLSRKSACAVGDGEGDRGMFEAVSLSVGFRSHPKVTPFITASIGNGTLADVVPIIKGYK